jgi:hypothetical protein
MSPENSKDPSSAIWISVLTGFTGIGMMGSVSCTEFGTVLIILSMRLVHISRKSLLSAANWRMSAPPSASKIRPSALVTLGPTARTSWEFP